MADLTPEGEWKREFGKLRINSFKPTNFREVPPKLRIDDRCDRNSLECYQYMRFLGWHGQRVVIDGPSDERAIFAASWSRVLLSDDPDLRGWVDKVIQTDQRFYSGDKPSSNEHGYRTLADEQAQQTREVKQLDYFKIKPKSIWPANDAGDWSMILTSLQWQRSRCCKGYSLQRLTPLELELAFLMFDWEHFRPRFAPWLFYKPEFLREFHRYLLKTYSFELLSMYSGARDANMISNAEGNLIPSDVPIRRDFKSARYSAGEFPLARISLRMIGLIVIGYLSCFAIDPLQHIIWFGPFWLPAAIALIASIVTWYLARVDVLKQHSRTIAPQQANFRAISLCLRLWLIASVLSLVVTATLFFPWPDRATNDSFLINSTKQSEPVERLVVEFPDETKVVARSIDTNAGETFTKGDSYLEHHPLQTLIGKTDGSDKYERPPFCRSVWQLVIASLTLASLSALLGITVQWLWEDKSAIEPI